MQIKWKIVKKNPEQGCVEVLWWDADSGLRFGPYNINVMAADGSIRIGDDLLRCINGHTPLAMIDEAVKAAALPSTAMAHIDAMIDVEHVADLNVFTTRAQVVQPQTQDAIADLATVQVV